jgi:hypothetical protein
MFTENIMWLLIAYTTGSVFTGWVFYKSGVRDGIENTIDSLVDKGFLRHRKTESDLEILKWNANEND